ncbi:MAG: DNA polymerase I [Gammaproteobacteria bacterium]|nr:MAG: DNA polymerase I [Gammaproteobacteria bacterium]
MILLVDGSSFLYRAHFANQNLNTSVGESCGAIYGTLNMLQSLIDDYNPQYFVVVFDARGKNHRHKIYDLYKAQRPPMPDDLRTQIEPLHNAVVANGWTLLSIPGVEADDVIATLAKKYQNEQQILIASSDKDLAQLVNQKVQIVDTMRRETWNTDFVYKKFGVAPYQIKDYLTLMGDNSDNIPGIKKCGPKTAAKWLNEYNSLNEVIKNSDKISGKVGENLRAGLDFLPTAYELVSLKTDVETEMRLENFTPKQVNYPILREIYEKYQFRQMLLKLNEQNPQNESHKYKTTKDRDELICHMQKIIAKKQLIFGITTSNESYQSAKIIGFYFCYDKKNTYYVPILHNDNMGTDNIPNALVIFKNILENNKIKKIIYNLKFTTNVLTNHDIKIIDDNYNDDIKIMAYSIRTTHKNDNLVNLCYALMPDLPSILLPKKLSDITGVGKKKITLNQTTIANISEYVGKRAILTQLAYDFLEQTFKDDTTAKILYQDLDKPLCQVLAQMEQAGVMLDAETLKNLSSQMAEQIKQLETKIYSLANTNFNINSPKQLGEILFKKMKIPVVKKTKSGAASTSEEVLEKLSEDYPLPKQVLKYRSIAKLKNTYVDKLPAMMEQKTHRIHTTYHPALTATGRLSSSEPNIQNIPIRSEQGAKIRSCFVAKQDFQILAADYSQIELRIMAHMAEDRKMIESFIQNQDIHTQTAAEVFNIPADDITPEHRRAAKAINFGLIYGMGAFGLAKQLKIGMAEAKIYIEKYFNRYPQVHEYMQNIQEIAQQQGFVETILKRKIYIEKINSTNHQESQYARRFAINAPIQGSAADLIKLSMLKIHQKLKSTPDIKMILQVHDELVFELPATKTTDFKKQIATIMNNIYPDLKVPLITDTGVGDNWQIAH